MSREDAIEPGEMGEVKVNFRVQSEGSVVQTVCVRTNDPHRPLVYLTLRGTVPQRLRVSPDRVAIRATNAAAPYRTFEIKGPPGLTLKLAHSNPRGLELTIVKVAETDANVEYAVHVKPKPEMRPGNLSASVSLETNDPERPVIALPVLVLIEGDLVAEPRTLFFGFLSVGAKARRPIVLRSRSLAPVHILSVECDSPDVSVAGAGHRKGNSEVLIVTINTKKSAFIDTTLKIHADLRGEETVTIPVTALIE